MGLAATLIRLPGGMYFSIDGAFRADLGLPSCLAVGVGETGSEEVAFWEELPSMAFLLPGSLIQRPLTSETFPCVFVSAKQLGDRLIKGGQFQSSNGRP